MLFIHRAERADRLVAALGDVLADPLPDPLATEVIGVHSRGIERWIAQELSGRLGTGRLGGDGVCAGVDFPFPGRIVQEAVARGSGIDPDTDPWVPERLTWALLELVEDPARGDPASRDVLGPLGALIGDAGHPAGGPGRRFGAVRHVADLFDRYGVHRPEMICRWRDGDDVGPAGDALDRGLRWQPALWRAVRARLDVPAFAERWDAAVRALRADAATVGHLPERFTLFGLTALPATYLQVVAAIAARRDVHLMLLHPSPDLWARVERTSGVAPSSALPVRDDDPTADLPRNPLLRSWGRDVRELQLLAPTGSGTRLVHHPGSDSSPTTLLQRLQHDVRSDRHPGPLDGPGRPPLEHRDRSVQLHDCHGRLRQVEVLREAVLHLLADQDDLEPRDIIVMCPDIEAFAPLVTAVFGVATGAAREAADRDGPPSLRVRLADRALRRTNPLLEVIDGLLELVDGRMTASSVMDLLSRPPVRRRFGLSSDDLDLIEEWVTDLRIRWGFDADHRVRHGLPPLDAHTWQAGVRRLLLGATMADEQWRMVGDVAPYDDVEGSDAAVAGRLVEFLERLSDALASLEAPRPAPAWRQAVARAADRLMLAGAGDEWQRLQLHRVLDDLVAEATLDGHASTVALTLAELRSALSERLQGRPSRTSHRTGDLTISTLVPMRSVPHRVVCLLGLDDGTFPRQLVPDGDDLLLRAPRVGDRDPRSEDRQLLLDALLAAQDTLIVTYAGRDERTNEVRPPAVPVDELRDAIDRTVTTDAAVRPSDAVTVRHPLAGHDPRNFRPGGLDGWPAATTPWGFDSAVQRAAEQRRRPGAPTPPLLRAPLPPIDDDVIDLDDLIAFLEHPVKAFVRRRLQLRLPSEEDAVTDAIPAELDGLDTWAVGQALLDGRLDGHDPARILDVLRASGVVPPGELATTAVADVAATVTSILDLCRRYGVTDHRRPDLDVTVDLPGGRTLTGVVPGINDRLITTIRYSKVKPKYRLATWARFLAATAQQPATQWAGITGGRPVGRKGRAKAQVVRLLPFDGPPEAAADSARRHLQRLIDLYERGMRTPLPLYCETSADVAAQLRKDDDPTRWAHKRWETDAYQGFPKEDADPYHLLVLGGQVPTVDLFEELCRDEEERSWADDDRRVVAYAWRLWEPVLEAEITCKG